MDFSPFWGVHWRTRNTDYYITRDLNRVKTMTYQLISARTLLFQRLNKNMKKLRAPMSSHRFLHVYEFTYTWFTRTHTHSEGCCCSWGRRQLKVHKGHVSSGLKLAVYCLRACGRASTSIWTSADADFCSSCMSVPWIFLLIWQDAEEDGETRDIQIKCSHFHRFMVD